MCHLSWGGGDEWGGMLALQSYSNIQEGQVEIGKMEHEVFYYLHLEVIYHFCAPVSLVRHHHIVPYNIRGEMALNWFPLEPLMIEFDGG